MKPSNCGNRFELDNQVDDPPCAAGFLWNGQMMMQISCRGYQVAQVVQP